MIENDQEYRDYLALSPENKMRARLQGLDEVISASGMQLLGDDELPIAPPEQGLPGTPLSAFGEGAAVFVPQSDPAIYLSNEAIAKLAARFDIPKDQLRAALDELTQA